MQKVEHIHISCGQSYSYNFLHLSIQEYLAAYYITSKGAKSTDLGEIVERFLSGLTGHFNDKKQKLINAHDCHCLYESQDFTFLEKVSSLDVYHGIMPTDMYVIGSCIALSKQQWKLNFQYNVLTDNHLEMLYAGINAQYEVTGCIEELNLFDNEISSSGIDHLLKLPLQSLQYLNISDNELKNDDCDKLAKFVPSLPHLESLNICDNYCITSGGHMNLIRAIDKLSHFELALSSPSKEECHLLMSLTNLQILTICKLSEIEVLATGLGSNTTLHALYLYDMPTFSNSFY